MAVAPAGATVDWVDEVVGLLRAAGKRITTSRRMLLQCLSDGGSHRTAEELAADIARLAPDVYLSTVYRNLEELVRLGVVTPLRLGDGPLIYHLAADGHGHFVCEGCGAVFEAPDEFFSELARAAFEGVGMQISPHRFAVVGTCASCRGRVTADGAR